MINSLNPEKSHAMATSTWDALDYALRMVESETLGPEFGGLPSGKRGNGKPPVEMSLTDKSSIKIYKWWIFNDLR